LGNVLDVMSLWAVQSWSELSEVERQ
jgi:hypothetical protein